MTHTFLNVSNMNFKYEDDFISKKNHQMFEKFLVDYEKRYLAPDFSKKDRTLLALKKEVSSLNNIPFLFCSHSSTVLVNKQHGMSKKVKSIVEDLIYNYDPIPHRIHIHSNRPNLKPHINRMPTLKQIQNSKKKSIYFFVEYIVLKWFSWYYLWFMNWSFKN